MTNRRSFLKMSAASLLAPSLGSAAEAADQPLPRRPVRGTDDTLAIIGLGNSNAFRNGDLPVATNLLDLYFRHGGNYIDASGSSATFVGGIAQDMGVQEQAFIANYINPEGRESMQQAAASLAEAQGKSALDLVHTREIQAYAANHADYLALKEKGLVRHIGVARTGNAEVQAFIAGLVEAGRVDFIQVNYSMLEPGAAERLLPLAQDKGVSVAISRPFINGNYFQLVRGHELPAWAAEFDCDSWAQFSLKYILSHPAVTCVLTETANPRHARDNIGAGFGRLPDEATRQRMAAHLQSLA
ncbi:MAG: aldo/keto reductase [Pseudomonadota bacterium]